MLEKRVPEQPLFVAFSALVGWIALYFGVPFLSTIGETVFGLGGLGAALLFFYAFPIITFFVSLFIVGSLLSLFKVKRAFGTSFVSSIIIAASIIFVLDYSGIFILLKMIYSLLLFVIVYELVWFLFSGYKTKIFLPLIIGVILSGFALSYLSTIEKQNNTRRYEEKVDINMKQSGIEFYLPQDNFMSNMLKDIKFMSIPDSKDSSYSWVSYVFSNGLSVTLFKAPSWYNPPQQCGYYQPSKKFIPLYTCLTPFTTEKGTIVYPASKQNNPKVQTYFAKINKTLLVLYFYYPEVTNDEVKKIVDSFEKITFEELDALKNQISQNH